MGAAQGIDETGEHGGIVVNFNVNFQDIGSLVSIASGAQQASSGSDEYCAFLLWCNDNRERMKTAWAEYDPSIQSFPEEQLRGLLEAGWREESPGVKERYTNLFKERKAQWGGETKENSGNRAKATKIGQVPCQTDKTEPKKKKQIRDKNAPKKNLNGYTLWSNDRLEETKQYIKNNNLDSTMLGKLLGQAWQKVDEATKAHYNDLAEADKERWLRQKQEYETQGYYFEFADGQGMRFPKSEELAPKKKARKGAKKKVGNKEERAQAMAEASDQD